MNATEEELKRFNKSFRPDSKFLEDVSVTALSQDRHRDESLRYRKKKQLENAKLILRTNIERVEEKYDFLKNEYEKVYAEKLAVEKESEQLKHRRTYLDALNRKSRQTYSRRLASYLSAYEWYCPPRNKEKLDVAWSYFENQTLPRHYCDKEALDSDGYQKSPPGEIYRATKLYSVLWTPLKELGNFGIGIGLYFTTLRLVAIITFIAGIINVAFIHFYDSSDYRGATESNGSLLLKGSASCSNFTWIQCSDCGPKFYEDDKQTQLYATAKYDSGLVFVVKMQCEFPPLKYALFPFINLVFLSGAFIFLNEYLERSEVRFDENEQTAQDYSILVKNPPEGALDPDEWREFFQHVTKHRVTVVTVAVDNKVLIESLYKRRVLVRTLFKQLVEWESYLKKHENVVDDVDGNEKDPFENPDVVRKIIERAESESVSPGYCQYQKNYFWKGNMLSIVRRIRELELLIIEESKRDESYKPSGIFLTFETEEGQRKALTKFDYGRIYPSTNRAGVQVDNEVIFRNKHILRIVEPSEPSTILYLELGTPMNSVILRICATFVVTAGLIVASCYLIFFMREFSTFYAAITISILNMIVPGICKLLHNVESHFVSGSSLTSLYFKMTLFRWSNTAIIISAITPHNQYIADGDDSLLPAVVAIFFAEMFTSPLVRVVDAGGIFAKHYQAPRAKSQAEMLPYFRGSEWSLAERYTDLTKILFLSFFYSFILPMGYFLCSFSLGVYYFADKFCLLRVWSPPPQLDTKLANISRVYFFPAAFLSLGTISMFFAAMFPSDSVCLPDDSDSPLEYATARDDLEVIFGDETTGKISIENKPIHVFCDKSLLKHGVYPAIFQDYSWHTKSQTFLVTAFGLSSVILLVIISIFIFGKGFVEYIKSWFFKSYEGVGESQRIDFSNVSGIVAYVPAVELEHLGSFEHPFLITDIGDKYISKKYVGWEPATGSYDKYNLLFDMKSIVKDSSFKGIMRSLEILGGKPQEKQNPGKGWKNAIFGSFYSSDIASKDALGSVGEEEKETETETVKFSIVKHYPPKWTFALNEA